MKKLLLVLGLGLFSFASMVAQTPSADTKDAAEITLDKTVYDFGTIGYASNGNFEFMVTNTGKTPLVISNVQKSCGCTSVDWTKEPIKSGDKGVIKVTYNTRIAGPFTKQITVFSNAKTPQVVLTFKGTVESAPPAEAPKQ